MKKQYEKIPELKIIQKNLSKINYLGVNIWLVMASPIYHWYENEYLVENFSPVASFKRILGFLLLKETFNISNNKKERILTSFFISEKDKHIKLQEIYLKDFSDDELIKVFINKKKFSILDFKNLVRIYKVLNNKEIRSVFGDKKTFFYFVAFVYYNFKQIKTLDNLAKNLSPKGYISFNCAGNKEESILTQLVKKYSGVTFNLQHGTFKMLGKFSTDYLIHENMISDYLFSWGKSSTEIIKKYFPRKDFKKSVLFSGNPNFYNKKEINYGKLKYGTFFLSGGIFRSENQKILDILEFFLKKNKNIKVGIKSHPGESLNNYRFDKKLFLPIEKNLEVGDILNDSDFVIGYNTTVLFEALRYRVPILQFKDKYSDLGTYVNFESFIDKKTFNLKFKGLKENKILKDIIKKQKIMYKNVFFQPKSGSISNHIKKIILKKI